MNDPSAPVRVLIVSPVQVHPTQSGGNLRSFGLANALARRGAEVFVYSFMGRKREYLARVPSGTQVWPGPGVKEYVNRSFLGFVTGYAHYWLSLPPLWITGFLHAASKWRLTAFLPRLLREKLAWCDVVIADSPFTYPILNAASARNRLRVLNLHNIEHHLIEPSGRWRDRSVRAAVRNVELAAAATADLLIPCSEQDGRYFESNCQVRRSLVVPNGIDVGRFRFLQATRVDMRNKLGFPDDSVRLFLFTASMYGPNREAFEFLRTFAKTHERELVDNGIHLLVVGSVVETPIRGPALTATGKVDAVEPYFAAADAALNPLIEGSGTNVKMGEFIAARLPILASSFGARGYRIEHGRTGFIFERENLVPSLVELRKLFVTDPARLEKMSDDALQENLQAIDMDECVVPLTEIFRDHRANRHDSARPAVASNGAGVF
jgi:glycosyltransferase involved in cell wall biosynthesis